VDDPDIALQNLANTIVDQETPQENNLSQ